MEFEGPILVYIHRVNKFIRFTGLGVLHKIYIIPILLVVTIRLYMRGGVNLVQLLYLSSVGKSIG